MVREMSNKIKKMLNKLKNKKVIFTIIIIFMAIAVIIIVALGSNSKTKKQEEETEEIQTEKTQESEEKSVEATKEYYCPDGFTLSGTVCNSTIETDALKTYVCDEGIPISSTGECSTYVEEYVDPIWYCTGTLPSMSETQINSYCTEKGYPRNLLGCPTGYYPNYQKNKCWRMAEKRTSAEINYLCSDDYKVDGDKCKKTTSVTANYKLKCPDGYNLSGENCIIK